MPHDRDDDVDPTWAFIGAVAVVCLSISAWVSMLAVALLVGSWLGLVSAAVLLALLA